MVQEQKVPLAERMRPHTFDAFVGQKHLVGNGAVLRNMVATGNIPSLILWGPPGVGKTTLALLISKQLYLPLYALSAVSAGVKEVRQVIKNAHRQGRALLLIDEIHRFNKSQQDALLQEVEKGTIKLIGTTTENPSFEVIAPLLSRCQVYVLEQLAKDELLQLMQRALKQDEYLRQRRVEVKETEALLRLSGGDARKLFNLLELVVEAQPKDPAIIDNEKVLHYAHRKVALYDKQGEQHYDIISAFIKSIRGSDPNAAVYWLARMIEGGEDPKFIARRLLILAAEDIGNANPTALVLANACFQAVEAVGLPECRIILAQTATYLAASPKSNAAYLAINKAQELVQKTGDLPVPLHLRNAPTSLMQELGYGKNYHYVHDYEKNFVEAEYFPEVISGTTLYDPGNNARENEIRKWLKERWKKKYGY